MTVSTRQFVTKAVFIYYPQSVTPNTDITEISVDTASSSSLSYAACDLSDLADEDISWHTSRQRRNWQTGRRDVAASVFEVLFLFLLFALSPADV